MTIRSIPDHIQYPLIRRNVHNPMNTVEIMPHKDLRRKPKYNINSDDDDNEDELKVNTENGDPLAHPIFNQELISFNVHRSHGPTHFGPNLRLFPV